MSPASRSKSKEKSSARAAKEQQKASKPSSASANPGTGTPAGAYNPGSGTFHMLETAPSTSSPPANNNGRFRTIDETDEHSGSSLGTTAEYDSVSNNDSCSGESEDQKEKTSGTQRPDVPPGCTNDKRDKIRQKNERKHQRQREKRAQELHERCSGYLMSRKLEVLAQQLVAMGFSSDRAMMALILNEGRVEESVAWLFEGGEEVAQQPKDSTLDGGGNLKIDISEELAQIADMETKCKYSRQEVERAVVACEGNLEKATETLRAQKQEAATAPLKQEEISNQPASMLLSLPTPNLSRTQAKAAVSSPSMQMRRDERDHNYMKGVTTPATAAVILSESGSRNLQTLRRVPAKPECARLQQASPTDKRAWPSASSSLSVSHSLASSLHVAPLPAKTEVRYATAGGEGKSGSVQVSTVREPVIMMQRPQSLNAKQNPATSVSSPAVSAGWYPNGTSSIEIMKANGGLGQVPSTSMSMSNASSQYHPFQYQPFVPNSVDSVGPGWGATLGSGAGVFSASMDPSLPAGGGLWSKSGKSLAVPSSLGLFTGWGSTGSSGSNSPVDWSTGGSIPECDYNNIDWSVESSGPTACKVATRPGGLWLGLTSFMEGSQGYESWSSGVSTQRQRMHGNGAYIPGLQEAVVSTEVSASSSGSHEWTSPFTGKDLFRLPRHSVSSPSL